MDKEQLKPRNRITQGQPVNPQDRLNLQMWWDALRHIPEVWNDLTFSIDTYASPDKSQHIFLTMLAQNEGSISKGGYTCISIEPPSNTGTENKSEKP